MGGHDQTDLPFCIRSRVIATVTDFGANGPKLACPTFILCSDLSLWMGGSQHECER